MSSPRCWVAMLDQPPAHSTVTAEVRESGGGASAGWLAVWFQANKPLRCALRADPTAFAANGPAVTVSFVLVPEHRSVLFDDITVQRARQRVLEASAAWTAVTTLIDDPVHFRGSLTARKHADGPFEDPFAAIAPARRLEVGPGLFSGRPMRLPAPVIERYAGQPWPQSGF